MQQTICSNQSYLTKITILNYHILRLKVYFLNLSKKYEALREISPFNPSEVVFILLVKALSGSQIHEFGF